MNNVTVTLKHKLYGFKLRTLVNSPFKLGVLLQFLESEGTSYTVDSMCHADTDTKISLSEKEDVLNFINFENV